MKKIVQILNAGENISFELSKSQSVVNLLSKNFGIVRNGFKNFEFSFDQDESGNLVVYFHGKILVLRSIIKVISNNNQNKRNRNKEVLVKSPMPGLVSKIKVKEGDNVKKGEGLLIIEAMKMENEIKSPIDGIIELIKIKPGSAIEKNAPLISIRAI